MRAPEPGNGLGLAEEPLHRVHVRGEVRAQDLERHLPVDHLLGGPIHGPHSAASQQGPDFVFPVHEGSLEGALTRQTHEFGPVFRTPGSVGRVALEATRAEHPCAGITHSGQSSSGPSPTVAPILTQAYALVHTSSALMRDPGVDILGAMERISRDLADLSRDMADLVKTLAERGETVFGEDRLPPPPRIEAPPAKEVQQRATAAPRSTHSPQPTARSPHPATELPRSFQDLVSGAASCTRCGLSDRRTKVVFGDGTGASGVMLIGEGPGRNEDLTGIPFVGRAGMLLDRMTAAVGFPRGDLYITNIVKCRPPRNRDPLPEEVQACRPYLNRQVETLTPKLVVAVGRPSVQSLLRTGLPLSQLRGRVHALAGIPLVVTYHPAYLLRSPAQKVRAWEDWRRIRDLLARIQAGGEVRVDGEEAPL